jgi:protein-disulfide isomerase
VPVLDQLIERYPTQVKIVYKHFPLRNRNMALKAARAAGAAESQGKFWEYHDQLFKNYNRLSDQLIQKIAESKKLRPDWIWMKLSLINR